MIDPLGMKRPQMDRLTSPTLTCPLVLFLRPSLANWNIVNATIIACAFLLSSVSSGVYND